jgi:hypothetical protein
MGLPDTIRVKISSEAAGSISLTPVVVQEISIIELLQHILAVTGKDVPRICEVLSRGSLVGGASRFRWIAIEANPSDLERPLSRFPDPDPALRFQSGRCVRAVLRGERGQVAVSKELAEKRRIFRDRSVWDVLMAIAAGGELAYAGYSYRERADRFRMELSSSASVELKRSTEIFSHLTAIVSADFYVER